MQLTTFSDRMALCRSCVGVDDDDDDDEAATTRPLDGAANVTTSCVRNIYRDMLRRMWHTNRPQNVTRNTRTQHRIRIHMGVKECSMVVRMCVANGGRNDLIPDILIETS